MLDLKSLIPFHHKSKDLARSPNMPSNLPSGVPVARDPFLSFRQEMDQLFDSFFNGGALGAQDAVWNGGLPKLEVTDGEKELTIAAELPGMEEKDVDVKISGDLLTIEGEKSEQSEKKEGESTYSERSYGRFSRTIRLPFNVGNEKVDATFDKGVLNIKLQKPAEEQKRVKHIEVKAA